MNTRRGFFRRAAVAAVIALTALGTAACTGEPGQIGTGTGGSDGGDGGDLETLSVGVQPVVAILPLYVGMGEGYFAEEGLQIEAVSGQTGPALVTQTINGQLDLAFVGTPVLINASASHIPLKLVTPTNTTNPAAGAESQILAAEGSGIDSPGDLSGKRVAVNSLESLLQTAARYAIEQDGGDGASVEWIEVPFPSMLSTLKQGEVDAVVVAEPFATAGVTGGAASIQNLWEALPADIPIASIATSASLANSNPEALEKFVRAWDKSVAFVRDNPQQAREYLTQYTSLDAAQIQSIHISNYAAGMDSGKVLEGIDFLAQLGVDYGYYDAKPDVSGLMLP